MAVEECEGAEESEWERKKESEEEVKTEGGYFNCFNCILVQKRVYIFDAQE